MELYKMETLKQENLIYSYGGTLVNRFYLLDNKTLKHDFLDYDYSDGLRDETRILNIPIVKGLIKFKEGYGFKRDIKKIIDLGFLKLDDTFFIGLYNNKVYTIEIKNPEIIYYGFRPITQKGQIDIQEVA